MTPHDAQYALADTAPEELPRVASDPNLVMRLSDGYVVEILPVTGGMDVQGIFGVVAFVGAIVLFVIFASEIGGPR